MSDAEVWGLLEAGGVWKFGPCEVVMDPESRNLIVFYKPGTVVRQDRPGRRRARGRGRDRRAARVA